MLTDAVEIETNVGPLWSHRGDAFTASLAEHGFWAIHLVRLFERRLGPGMTFVDIGAQVGYFSVLASQLVGATGRVVAVEPNPASVELLRANVTRRGNVEVLPVAAWDSRARLPLVLQPGSRSESFVMPPGSVAPAEGQRVEVQVPALPLDELVAGRVDVLKSDAEGADHLVVAGARRLLAECPLAVVEFCPAAVETVRPGTSARTVAEGYLALGRALALVTADGGLDPVDVDELAVVDDLVDLALLRPA